jgi:hypothetical protein
MQTNGQPPRISKGVLWLGYVLSGLPALLLVFSAVIKLMKPPQVVEGFAHFGIPESLIFNLGILELSCTVVYLIPSTSILGRFYLLATSAGRPSPMCALVSHFSSQSSPGYWSGEGFTCATIGCARSFRCDASRRATIECRSLKFTRGIRTANFASVRVFRGRLIPDGRAAS